MDHTDINNQTQETLNLFYRYVSEKNSKGIISMLSEDVDWCIVQSQKLPWTGRLKKKAIAQALNLLFDAHVDGEDFLEMDHHFIDGQEAAIFGTITKKVKEDTPEILKAFKKDRRFKKINH